MSSLPPESRARFTQPRFAAALLIACSVLPYAGTWSHGFIDYDDEFTIVNLPLIRVLNWHTLPEFFRPKVYPGLPEYMPLKNLSYAVDYALFGLSPSGFRIQQMLWYTLGVLLLWVWLRALLHRLAEATLLRLPVQWADRIALVTSILFALHPVHVESVTWLSGRKDVLSGAFMIASLYCALRYRGRTAGLRDTRWLWASLATGLLALLSKPTAVMLCSLVVLQDVVSEPASSRLRDLFRLRWALYVGHVSMAASFSWFYITLIKPYAVSAADADFGWRLFEGPPWLRWGQQLMAFAELSFTPTKLVPVMPPNVLDPDWTSTRALLGLVFLATLCVLAVIGVRRRHPLVFALGLFVLPIAPMLFSPAWAQYVAGRYMYHCVAGALLGLVWCCAWVVEQRPALRRVTPVAAALFAIFLVFTTLDYNERWRSSLTLWLGSIEVFPTYTQLYDKAAQAAIREGKPQLAVGILARCLQRNPDDLQCSLSLGSLVIGNQPEAGERMLRRGLPLDATGKGHELLARHLAARGNAAEGYALYAHWLDRRAVRAEQLQVLARLAVQAHLPREAFSAAVQWLRAEVQVNPALPPPSALLEEIAAINPSSQVGERIHHALQQCQRVDCALRLLSARGG